MGSVSADLSSVMQAYNNMKNAVSSIESTKTAIDRKYQQLGMGWNDRKYQELGGIISESKKALNSVLKTLLMAEKAIVLLIGSIQEYEDINIGGSGAAGSASGAAGFGSGAAGSASGAAGFGSGAAGSGSGMAAGSSIRVSQTDARLEGMPSDTYGTQLNFARDNLSSERFFSQGNHYEAFQDYWEHLSDYSFVRDENPRLMYVPARNIEGVYLSEREVANPQGFWTRNGRDDYSRANILQRASHVHDVAAALNNGHSPEEISQVPELAGCYDSYFESPVQVASVGDFLVFESDGRHRTLASQTLDAYIPVLVVGSYVPDRPMEHTLRRTR